jgi:hypothetical protein
MTVRRIVVACGLIGGLHTVAFAQQDAVSLDGSWTGRTSQGQSIAFRIEAGSMRMLDLDWTMELDQLCPGRSGSAPSQGRIERGEIYYFHPQVKGSEPPPIRSSAFTLSRGVDIPQVPITLVLSGSFGSDSTVSGEMALTATGCPGRETVTWKAGRKTARGR